MKNTFILQWLIREGTGSFLLQPYTLLLFQTCESAAQAIYDCWPSLFPMQMLGSGDSEIWNDRLTLSFLKHRNPRGAQRPRRKATSPPCMNCNHLRGPAVYRTASLCLCFHTHRAQQKCPTLATVWLRPWPTVDGIFSDGHPCAGRILTDDSQCFDMEMDSPLFVPKAAWF